MPRCLTGHFFILSGKWAANLLNVNPDCTPQSDMAERGPIIYFK